MDQTKSRLLGKLPPAEGLRGPLDDYFRLLGLESSPVDLKKLFVYQLFCIAGQNDKKKTDKLNNVFKSAGEDSSPRRQK